MYNSIMVIGKNNRKTEIRLSIICLGIFVVILLNGFNWQDFNPFENPAKLAEILSEKLSKPGEYSVQIERINKTFPEFVANHISFNKASDTEFMLATIGELTLIPDFNNTEIGTHSFVLKNGSLLFRNDKFMFDSPNFQLSGNFQQQQIYVASSSFDAFGGRIELIGHADISKAPYSCELDANLIFLKLEDVLKGTQNQGMMTGRIYSRLKLRGATDKKSPIYGNANVVLADATYNNPEFIKRVNDGLHSIGIRSSLHEIIDDFEKHQFSLFADFDINDKVYTTNNMVAYFEHSKVTYAGSFGPGSDINGTLHVKFKDYSTFEIKVSGSKSNLNYDISSSDKAQIASIVLREIGKDTEQSIKAEGKRFNMKTKKTLKDWNIKSKNQLDEWGHKLNKWFNKL